MTMTLATNLTNKKFFLWDFDGTFADTERWHCLAVNEALKPFSHSVSERDYFRYFSFLGEGIAGELKRHNLAFDLNAISNEYRKNYWSFLLAGRAQLFSEVPTILEKTRSRGAKIAIVSNSGEDEIKCVLEHARVTHLVDLVVGRNAKFQKKPAPDLFLEALRILNADAAETLILEDSEIGLRAAHAAKCDAIWLRTPINAELETEAPRLAELTHKQFLDLVIKNGADANTRQE